MNLLLRLTLVLLFFSSAVDAQSFKKRYKDQLVPGSKLIDSGFAYTIEKTKEGTVLYKKYYPDTKQMTHLITFKSKDLSTLHGLHSEWMDNGKLWFTGNYQEGKRDGEWIEWTWENYYAEGTYKSGLKEGKWMTSNPGGKVLSRETFQTGKLHGLQQYFNKEGELKKEVIYKEGELLKAVVVDSAELKVFKIVEEMPTFPGCERRTGLDSIAYKKCAERKLLEFVYGQIRYPQMAREMGIEGKAHISFVINKEGVVEDLEIIRGVCDVIKAECYRVVESMPVWHPGKQNGKPVKVRFTLPVKFNLE